MKKLLTRVWSFLVFHDPYAIENYAEESKQWHEKMRAQAYEPHSFWIEETRGRYNVMHRFPGGGVFSSSDDYGHETIEEARTELSRMVGLYSQDQTVKPIKIIVDPVVYVPQKRVMQ